MVLSFSNKFNDKILSGGKIHTIRENKGNRWKVGQTIHFANYVRTMDYTQFFESTCKGIQKVKIDPKRLKIYLADGVGDFFEVSDKAQFIKNDGFDNEEEFWAWFKKPFEGIVIHWTDKVYYY